MSRWDDVNFVEQGWQCPLCGTVYAPFVISCLKCNQETNDVSTESYTNTNMEKENNDK